MDEIVQTLSEAAVDEWNRQVMMLLVGSVVVTVILFFARRGMRKYN